MIRFKKMPKQKMPIFLVDQLFTTQGFMLTGTGDFPVYSATLRDASTQISYHLMIPVQVNRLQKNYVNIGHAYIEKDRIPHGVRKAAQCKLFELTDYLMAWNQRIMDKKRTNKREKFNSMVHHFEDAESLGKEMNGMETNQTIEEEGQIPDPIQ